MTEWENEALKFIVDGDGGDAAARGAPPFQGEVLAGERTFVEGKRAQFADESMIKAMCEAMGFYDSNEIDWMCNCSIEFLLLTHTFFSIMQFSFFFCSFLRPTKREKAFRFFCTQKEKGNKRDQISSHSSSLGASGHHHQPVANRVLFGNDKKKSSTRSRSSRLFLGRANALFCRTMSSCLFG